MPYIPGFYQNIPANADYSAQAPDEEVYLSKQDSPSIHTNGGLFHLGDGIVVTRDGEIEVDIPVVRELLGSLPAEVDINQLAQQLISSGQLDPDVQDIINEIISTGQLTPDTAAIGNQLIASGTLSPYVTTIVQQILAATGGGQVDLEALKEALLADPNFSQVDVEAIQNAAINASLQAIQDVIANLEGGEIVHDYGVF